MASEIFEVQEATLSEPIKSSSSVLIMDHGIKAPTTLYVLWLSTQHVQVNVNVYCFFFLSQMTTEYVFGLCKLMYCVCL